LNFVLCHGLLLFIVECRSIMAHDLGQIVSQVLTLLKLVGNHIIICVGDRRYLMDRGVSWRLHVMC
jgi:hypothetical protein